MRTDNLLWFLAIQSTAFHLPPVFNVICADAQCSFPRKTVPVWTPKGDATAPATSEVTESLCRSLCLYIQENCWSFFACCLSDVAVELGDEGQCLGTTQATTLFAPVWVGVKNKTWVKKPRTWRRASKATSSAIFYVLFPLPVSAIPASPRWKLSQLQMTNGFALRHNSRCNRKRRGKAALLGLLDYAFLTPQIESNWKYLGNSGDLRLVYTADENNWPKCLYI